MTRAGERSRERDYSHRDVLVKLGWREDLAFAVDETSDPLDADLAERLRQRGAEPAADSEPLDLVLATATVNTNTLQLLARWRARLEPTGGIWLLTPKRGQPGYVNQSDLIVLGPAAGLVDNKVCSVSDRTSAIRFVVPRSARSRG